MVVRQIKPGIYSLSTLDWDRRLFDELIPLPDGTSYNAYLIKGSEKTALIDSTYTPKWQVLVSDLKMLNVEKIDYIVCNHAEMDHSGAIPHVLELYPEAKVVCSKMCREFLMEMLLIKGEKIMTVSDGEKLSLGDKALEFIYAPWVHWPETMLTYLREDKILFTCDLFGSHLATSDTFARDEARVHEAAKRYYAEIMMPFRTSIRKHLEKIKKLELEMIAPSHGPVYDKPEFIINAYENWVSEEVKNEVVIAYVSMYEDTGKMAEYLANALMKKGITVKMFNLTKTDIGELAMALVDAATMIIGSPTVLAKPHPVVAYAVHLINALRPKLRFISIIGSYGWGENVVENIKKEISALKAQMIEPVIVRGHPKEKDFAALDRMAEEIYKLHRENNIVER
ncbi:MAG: FprA family A-type flavoprotein [Candidatus Hadarchaeales archaeon]